MTYQNGVTHENAEQEPSLILEQSLYTSEVAHRIANSLSILASSVSNRARHLSKQRQSMSIEEVSLLLNEISARIAAVGKLHRDIATQPEAAHLDLNEHLWKLCDSLIAALAQPGQFELLRGATATCAIETDKVLPVCMIVAELVTNALKYAHPTGVRGRLVIGCRREADGSVIVEVADDGVGLPDGFDPTADGGLGSRTVRLLAKQLGAEVSFVSRPIGLCVELRLPASMAR